MGKVFLDMIWHFWNDALRRSAQTLATEVTGVEAGAGLAAEVREILIQAHKSHRLHQDRKLRQDGVDVDHFYHPCLERKSRFSLWCLVFDDALMYFSHKRVAVHHFRACCSCYGPRLKQLRTMAIQCPLDGYEALSCGNGVFLWHQGRKPVVADEPQ